MPMDQLEQLVMQRAQELQAVAPMGEGAALAQEPAPAVAASNGPAPEQMASLELLDPAIIAQAMTVLVAAGAVPGGTTMVTADMLPVLQQLADAADPGLYDVSVESDLEELLKGIANGTVHVGTGQPPAKGSGQSGVVGGGQRPSSAGGEAF